MAITIRNWSSFQSYKDRKPPWIRLHKSLLDNFEYQSMTADARALLPMLWLLASEDDNPVSGTIRFGYERVAFRLRMDAKYVERVCGELVANGFIDVEAKQVTYPYRNRYETVTSETETETETEGEGEEPPPPNVEKSVVPEKPSAWVGGDPSKIAVNNFRDWRRTPYAQHHIGIMASLYGESFVRDEIGKIEKWLAGNPEYKQGNWLKWANNWVARTYKERESKGPPAPISAEQERAHYEGHRRSGAVNGGFTSIGDITTGEVK